MLEGWNFVNLLLKCISFDPKNVSSLSHLESVFWEAYIRQQTWARLSENRAPKITLNTVAIILNKTSKI